MFSTVSEDEVLKMAEQVSRKVHRDYPSVEAAEIKSEALIHIAETELKAPTPGKVYHIMAKAAYIYAAKERYRQMLETSQYIYLPVEVRALLTAYWDPDKWDVPSARDDYLYAAVEGRTVAVSLMDIKVSMERLKGNHRKALERKFRDDQDVHTQTVYNAVQALTRELNRGVVDKTKNHNGPGARRAITNDRGQHFVRLDTEVSDEKDAVSKTQTIYRSSPSKPAGTFYDWDKYKEGND